MSRLTTPRSIRVYQGGAFARSDDLRTIVSKHGYVVESTGSDNPSQNGRVERLDQTFGVMVAYFGETPDLSHLRAFGSVITPRASGDRPATIERVPWCLSRLHCHRS
jgi:hypothetical protein